jgi:hypothetical protein
LAHPKGARRSNPAEARSPSGANATAHKILVSRKHAVLPPAGRIPQAPFGRGWRLRGACRRVRRPPEHRALGPGQANSIAPVRHQGRGPRGVASRIGSRAPMARRGAVGRTPRPQPTRPGRGRQALPGGPRRRSGARSHPARQRPGGCRRERTPVPARGRWPRQRRRSRGRPPRSGPRHRRHPSPARSAGRGDTRPQ